MGRSASKGRLTLLKNFFIFLPGPVTQNKHQPVLFVKDFFTSEVFTEILLCIFCLNPFRSWSDKIQAEKSGRR